MGTIHQLSRVFALVHSFFIFAYQWLSPEQPLATFQKQFARIDILEHYNENLAECTLRASKFAHSMPGVTLPTKDKTSIVHGLSRDLFVKVIETWRGF